MTLVEVVVALVVLMLVLVPIALLLTNVLGQAATSRARLAALSVAERCIETLGNTGPTVTGGVPKTATAILEDQRCMDETPVTVSTVTYKVYAEFRWTTAEGDHPDLCTSGSVPSVMDLAVWVTWAHTQRITDATVLDYPPPGLPADGFIAVQLNGSPAGAEPPDASGRSWSTRVQTIPVQLASSTFTTTLYPDTAGCAFQEVPPGTYTVTASDPQIGGQPAAPSWTSAGEMTTASSAGVVVGVGGVTFVTLRYDEGSLVGLSYPTTTATGGEVVCPGAGSLSCLAFGQEPAVASSPGKTPVAELSVLSATSNWTVSRITGVVRLDVAACAGTTRCIAVGYGGAPGTYSGASISSATSGAPSFGPDALPSGVTALTGITCPSSSRCFAYGTGGTGAVVLTGAVSSSAVTWTKDTLSVTPARVTHIACASATHCALVATKGTSTSPVVLSLATATSWTADALPSTATGIPTTLATVACPSTSICYAVGTSKSGTLGEIVSPTSKTAEKWVRDTLPATVSDLSRITCPSATSCTSIGTLRAGTSLQGAIVSRTSTTPQKWVLDSSPETSGLSDITCPSTSACAVLGSTASGPAILWRTGVTTYEAAALPNGIDLVMLHALDCAAASQCFAAGVQSTSSGERAVILSGTSSWVKDTLPSSVDPEVLDGVACAATICAAPGSTQTGALYLDAAPTGSSWSDASPAGTKGMVMGGVPVDVTDTGLSTPGPLEVAVPAGTGLATTIGPLFPFQAGYSVGLGECAPLPASAEVTSVPGATASATLPMGLLSLRVVNTYGDPDTGATISAAPICATHLAPPPGATNPSSFALSPTGPTGASQAAVPYGSYTVTVTHASTVTRTVVVAPASITVTGVLQEASTPATMVVT